MFLQVDEILWHKTLQVVTHQFTECKTHVIGCVTVDMSDINFIVAFPDDEAFSIVDWTDEFRFVSNDLMSIISTFAAGIHKLYWRDNGQQKQADDKRSTHNED